MSEIGLVEVSEGVREASLAAGAPFETANPSTVTLRFLLSAHSQKGLDALRDARRALLREEWTRGRDPDEPPLEDAVFSATEVLWAVRSDQRSWCLKKLEELLRRANQFLTDAAEAHSV
jgi:hypothetical protein